MKLNELLNNVKVEWKKLSEVTNLQAGDRITKSMMNDSLKYCVYGGGVEPTGKYDKFNFENSITISRAGSAGFVNFIKDKFWATDVCFVASQKENNANIKFIFYYVKSMEYELKRNIYGGNLPKLNKDFLWNLLIPVPPLEIQEKIVKILDKFTNYATELQTELQLRIKQYEYYRNLLLSKEFLENMCAKFDDEVAGGRLNSLKVKMLGEIGKFTRGNGLQKKDFIKNGKSVIHYGQIYTMYGFSADKTFSFVDDKLFSKLQKAKNGDILMATTSENISDVCKCVVWQGKDEIAFGGDMYKFSTSENSCYLAYYFQTDYFQKQKERKVSGTKLIRIHSDDLNKFIIFLPPLQIQEKIVQILDKFSEISSNLEKGLPKEIDLRQKEYEFYRDLLLNFKKD